MSTIFTDAKQRYTISRVLANYGVKLEDRGKGDKIGQCPFCKDNSFRVSVEKNVWRCFACKNGGNAIDFVAIKELITVKDAAKFMLEWDEAPPEIVEEGNKPLVISITLDPSKTPFLQTTAEYFEAGHCSKGLMRGKVAISIHSAQGELLAYVGKEEGKDDKYPGNYKKGHDIYNLHRCTGKHVYVCKDYYEVWKWHEEGQQAVAIMSDALSYHQRVAFSNTKLVALTIMCEISHGDILFLTEHKFVRCPAPK